MICKTYKLGELGEYKFVVVLSQYDGQILLSRHKERATWETQGGHIEQGETALDTAKRELWEESGAVDFDIEPVFDYFAGDEKTGVGSNGMVFFANIHRLSELPKAKWRR